MTIYPVPKPPGKSVPKPEGRGKRPPHPLKRSRMKKVNRKRGGHMFPKNVDEGLREWIRELPCAVCLANDPNVLGPVGELAVVEVAHVKSRGAGGADRNNVIPLCRWHHVAQHAQGIRSFEKWWRVDLKQIAHALTAQYEAETFPCP